MKNPVRTGTMIALAAAGLFTGACSKADSSSAAKPKTAQTTAEPKAAGTDVKAPSPAPAAAPEKSAKIQCKLASNGCNSKNGCGAPVEMTEQDCKANGGTVVAKK